jgi:peptidoglycan hydrolase-like protein with peptidoglycan-binding domain
MPAVTAALPDRPTAAPPAPPAPEPAPPAKPPTIAALPAAPAREPEKPTKLVRAIQKNLTRFGYKSLPHDGLPGAETRAAVLALEFDQERPLSGEPAETTLSALVFLEASGRTRLPSADAFERNTRLVREVQEHLATLGYGAVPQSGHLDGKTREAIRRFETDHGLQGEGRLTERVLLEMVIERGKPFMGNG